MYDICLWMCIKIRIKNKTSSVTLKRNGKVYTRKLPIQWSVVLFMDSGKAGTVRTGEFTDIPKRPISLSPEWRQRQETGSVPRSDARRSEPGPGYANNCQPPRTQAQKFLYVLRRQKMSDHQRLQCSAGLSWARSYNSDMQQKISPVPLQRFVCSN